MLSYSLLTSLATLKQKVVSFMNLGAEISLVGKELLKVDDGFIKEHTGNSWCKIVTKVHLDDSVD